ncbi:MAG: hypothetical protein J2P21_08860 [Chloracidobacterium sp.]|nr:hypothetical protein [Chloracidobacterium sp.]
MKKASAIRALEAEAEARVAKAQEKLLQVEASLRLEMSRRLELERKTQEIVLELKNQQEIDQNRIAQDQVEAERITSEAAARFEEERGMRVAAEQAKAEAETKLTELEARLIETEERLRQANSELQQERLKLTKAQERADELEVQLIAEAAKSEAEAEGKIQEIRAEARRVEENYMAEINRFRGEQEMALKAAEEAEENHKTEIARITADAELRTQQAEAEIRQKLQIKVDETIAAQEAIRAEARRLEENYRVEINRFRDEQEMAMKAAGEAEENHKTEIVRITAEAESRTQQAEAEIRRQLQIKIDEAIASAQDAMFKLEETQKKLDEAEARCQGMDSRARQAETQLRQINLIQRMNSALIGQVIEGSLKTSDKNGPESLPFDLPAEVNEILNALFMPEDLSVPEGLRDLPDDSESPTMSVDDHSVDITDIASPIDESAQSPPLWGLD